MKQTNEQLGENLDKEILFSKTIKAGKRVYYIDVKKDRRDALYLSITESKRIKEGNEEERPVFEKHKIFLYREDLEKFMAGITAAVNFAMENSPAPDYSSYRNDVKGLEKPEYLFAQVDCGDAEEFEYGREERCNSSETADLSGENIKIDLDF